MQKVLQTIICCCLLFKLSAQESFIIKGFVVEEHKKPLQQITVALLQLKDSTVVALTQTDSSGYYQFSSITAGTYFVKTSAASMQDAFSKPLQVVSNAPVLVVHTIMMTAFVNTLQEVKVTAQAKPVEIKEGKMIYNIEQSITASGSSAFETLRKMPGINVDQDENILLKGNSNVNVMIDGKMTYLSAQQLSVLLKGMPAESISRIEISANPSSEFDAAGNSGVINIVTKKLNRDGYSLNIGAIAGTGKYANTTETVAGNIKTKHFNFFGSYTHLYKKSYLDRTSYRIIENNDATIVYDRQSFDPEKTSNHNYKSGINFYLDKNNSISFVYNGYSNNWSRDANGATYLKQASGKVDSVVQNHNITNEPQHSNAYTLNYNLKLDTVGNTFSIDADYASYKNNSSGYLGNQLFTTEGTALQPYQQLNFQQPSNITIRSVKADIKFDWGKTNFKAGLKYAFVRTDNNAVFDSLIGGSYIYSTALSNHFIYDEKVFAGYLSASRQFKKAFLNAGVRVENTASIGNSITANIVTKRNYTNVFPFVSLDYDVNDNNKIGLSVTRRIDRPVYSNLNPFRYFFDKYSYYEGNPFLQPEFAWNTMLSYTLKDKYIVQLTYSRTNQPIAEFATQDAESGVLKVSTINFSHKDNIDATFIVPVTIGKYWSMQNMVDLFYTSYYSHQLLFEVKRLTAIFSTTQTLKLPQQVSFELMAEYETPATSGVYIQRPWFTVDAGLKKTIKKLDIKLSCTDIFKTIHYWGYSVYDATNVSYNHTGDTRRITLGLLYHFGGKLSAVKREKLDEEKRL